MKKKVMADIVVRCLNGAPIGIAINTVIAIVVSLLAGDGTFYAVVPELADDCGTELNAVILQAIFSLLYGAAWGGASIIWQMEEWSLLRQTVTHQADECKGEGEVRVKMSPRNRVWFRGGKICTCQQQYKN